MGEANFYYFTCLKWHACVSVSLRPPPKKSIMNHSINASSSLNGSSMRVPVSDPFDDAFFDMDDILASQERVACVVETPLRGLGFLDSSYDAQDLAAGTKLELPFWVVKDLA